jgi:hypothetical protein
MNHGAWLIELAKSSKEIRVANANVLLTIAVVATRLSIIAFGAQDGYVVFLLNESCPDGPIVRFGQFGDIIGICR